ncbi:MAG: efflux RND transporter periplasmic adaptor subunit, partial [Clostridia bacterium]|nr:efflux RND transporter periplasmic adaptor subunit [Deltaproteobacteria bacterium]
LHSDDDKLFAYVKKGDTFEKREVTLGMQSETHAVALAGLSSGDEVRVN